MPDPHVDDKKGKKPWYIRRGKTEERGTEKKQQEKKRKITSLGACSKRLIAMFHVRILNLFTLKSNILAQDQTSFLSCTL